MGLDIYLKEVKPSTVYSGGITNNVVPMAEKAGIYKILCRPEESGIKFAADLIQPLEKAILEIINNRASYEALNPENGWGSYETFLNFVIDLANACKRNPLASVQASR